MKKKEYYSRGGVHDTRFPRPTTPRGRRRSKVERTFPEWAFKPRFIKGKNEAWVEDTSHLIRAAA